ncbi:MAG: IS1634 family transposase [Conexivisphaerales archaeon]
MDLQPFLESFAQLPPKLQQRLAAELKIDVAKATPAGAVLIGFSLAQTFGVGETIDYLLGEEHLSVQQMQDELAQGVTPRISTGTACEVLIADMLGCYKNLTRLYHLEEACEAWRVRDILGLPPEKLNDDRLGRALDTIGENPTLMGDILQALVLKAAERFGIPLKRFYNDTTAIPVWGERQGNDKVQFGHGGLPGLQQLILNLTILAGPSLPVTAVTDPGNVQGGRVFDRTLKAVAKLTQDEFEIIIDRGILTHLNMHLMLTEKRAFFIGPLKEELCRSWVLDALREAGEKAFTPIAYRSKEEARKGQPSHYEALETTYTFKVELNRRQPGEARKKKGERRFIEHTVRAVIYRDNKKKERDAEHRAKNIAKVESELKELQSKLNKRNLCTVEACQGRVQEIFRGLPELRRAYKVTVGTNAHGAVTLTWEKDEEALKEAALTDGLFVLLTNHPIEAVDANELLTRYRGRNDIEMSYRFLKGALDLNQIFLRKPSRVDAYCYLKVLAMFVLNLAHWFLIKEGQKKMTPQKLQELLGNTTIVEQRLEPFGIRHWVGTNVTEPIRILIDLFHLPDPVAIVEAINAAVDYHQVLNQWSQKAVT